MPFNSTRLVLVIFTFAILAGGYYTTTAALGAGSPVLLSDRDSLALAGSANCSPGDANCACIGDTCGTAGCTYTATCTAVPGSGGAACMQIRLDPNMAKCGQVNNSFPNGCGSTTDPNVKCAQLWGTNYPGSMTPCSYPGRCQNNQNTTCGGQLTTCAQK